MQKWGLAVLIATMLLLTWGCTRPPASEQGAFEQRMLKALLDKEIAESARRQFNSSYDPKNGRVMQVSEIFEFLNDRKVSIDSLPPDLQSALKKNRVIGVLVSRLDPIPVKKVKFVPVKLDALHKMLLAWEISRDRAFRAVWFNGADGAGDSPAACPNDEPKCLDLWCCTGQGCEDKFISCIGQYKCPPCEECRRCPGDIPISSIPGEETTVARLFCKDPPRVSLSLSH